MNFDEEHRIDCSCPQHLSVSDKFAFITDGFQTQSLEIVWALVKSSKGCNRQAQLTPSLVRTKVYDISVKI